MSITTTKVIILSALALLVSQPLVAGSIVIDGTASTLTAAIKTNMGFKAKGDKSDTPIESPYPKGNAINIDTFQILTRDLSNPNNTTPPPAHKLKLTIGNTGGVINANNKYATNQNPNPDPLFYFNNGKHLFDIDRFRDAANWLAQTGNVTPDQGVAAKTYGTIMFRDFIDNIANNRTMYGLVRVLIPLQKVTTTVNKITTTNYGFCNNSAAQIDPNNPSHNGPGCGCAPNGGNHITAGTLCGITISASNSIKVKGALLWDFVDHLTGAAINLNELPIHPRDLYFKVEIPIWVNWSADITNSQTGIIDYQEFTKRLDLINNKTASLSAGNITPTITESNIPKVSKAAYNYQISGNSNSTDFKTQFDGLSLPNKYHLLMPSGYADGWADAFNKLNLTRSDWVNLPTDNTMPKFKLPSDAPTSASGDPWTADHFRSEDFEDIPAYMYTGGLIDMHDHVFISGLMYVPQAMELEAQKKNNYRAYQYIIGSIVIRDGFYIEAEGTSVTVISTDPMSFSNILVSGTSPQQKPIVFGQSVQDALSNGTPDAPPNSGLIVGLPGNSGSGNGNNNLPPAAAWTEIVPAVPANLP